MSDIFKSKGVHFIFTRICLFLQQILFVYFFKKTAKNDQKNMKFHLCNMKSYPIIILQPFMNFIDENFNQYRFIWKCNMFSRPTYGISCLPAMVSFHFQFS